MGPVNDEFWYRSGLPIFIRKRWEESRIARGLSINPHDLANDDRNCGRLTAPQMKTDEHR
jgi:hypothetical protein